jgi:hypothetical protein
VEVRRLVGLLAFVAGCDYLFNLDPINAPRVDGAVDSDAEIVYMDAPGCFGHYGPGSSGLALVCLTDAPPDTWTPNGELHTGVLSEMGDCAMKIAQSGVNTDMCVIVARNITLGGYLPTSGNRPVVFVATDTFTLLEGATIGVDSRRNSGRNGAGSNEASCPSPANGSQPTTAAGRSGGGGGSFATKGGNGGNGQGGTAGAMATQPIANVAVVRGGCKGGTGGGGTANGASGGAVYIIAGKQIVIAGTIDASGEAGAGGNRSLSDLVGGDGGGGGGSGGLIGLDAPLITIAPTAKLSANGGGGGGGGDGNFIQAINGSDGKEAQLDVLPNFPAPGGPAGSGGDGGKGYSGTTPPDPGAPAGNNALGGGGGGGGGGAGFIKFFSSSPIDIVPPTISPPPS